MINSATELILLNHASFASPEVDYTPTFISTDKRKMPEERTSLGYYQIGVAAQYGLDMGPVYKVEFADLSAVTAGYIKIWGIGNKTDDAPIYPKSYLIAHPIIDVYLRKFEFVTSAGVTVAPGGAYTIVGYKKKAIPYSF
jgi:hypothetical protein